MVAKKNIIEGAAHGSSGASELKTRKAGLLTSAKKTKSILSFVGAIFFVLSSFCQDSDPPLVDTNQVVTVQLAKYNGTSLETTDVLTTLSDVPYRFLSQPVAVRFSYSEGLFSLQVPSLSFSNTMGLKPGNLSYSQRPVKDSSNGLAYPYKYFPRLQALYRFVESCYISGIASTAFDVQSTSSSGSVYCNVDIPTMFALCLSSTNGVYRSRVIDFLSNIRDNSSESLRYLDDISNSIVDFSTAYEKVNFYDFNSFDTVVDYAASASYISPSHAQYLKDQYSSLSSNPSKQQSFDRATRDLLREASRVTNGLSSLLADDTLKDVGDRLNEGLNDTVEGGFSASAHIQGATTNLLQKMTNMTDQIKKDLEAWRTDATNRLEQQLKGIKDVKDNTGDTAAGVSTIVNKGVKINGPVEVTLGTDNINVDIANTDLDSLIDGFADGSDAAIQRWLDEWELFKDSQLPYMSRFSSFIRDNTNVLSSIYGRLDFGFTNTLDATYAFLTNGLESAISNGVAGIGLDLTNELWGYYFDRFQKANEFRDDDGQLFTSIDNQRRIVFGNGFDDSEYKKLDWFSRVELLLYQIGYASTNGTESIEASDLEGEFDGVSDEIQMAASSFEGASRRVVGVFSLIGRFAQAVKNAFSDIASPSTDGILLLEGGSWIVEEPLYLRVPLLIQNALRLVFQCVWYLSAFVIGWRLVSFAWGRVSSLVRWLWSLIDV